MAEVPAPTALKSEEKVLEQAMTSMIDLMSRLYRNQVILELNQTTVDKFQDAQSGNYAYILTKLSTKVSKSLVSRFDNKRIEKLVKSTFEKDDRRSKQIFYSRMAKEMGVDPATLLKKDGMTYDFNALVLETTQWAKKLRDETLELYTANTLRAMTLGQSVDEILEQYDGMVSKRKNHAEFTARNQIQNFNSIMNKTRSQKLGITKAVWVSSHDERVRPSHAQRDGKEFDLDKGLYSSIDGKYLLPGTDYNCFEGSLEIDNTSVCKKLYRRFFSGELTEIVSDDGVILPSTGNHPILTDKGFKAANLINTGDYIVKIIDDGVDLIKLYGYNPKPTFEQLFTSLDLLGVERSVAPRVSGKFHGDISDSDIDVISMDSLLSDEIKSSVSEKFRKLNLSNTDEIIVLDFFTCLGYGFSGFNGTGLSSDAVVSCLDLVLSRFIIHLTPLELFCFTLGSWSNSAIEEPISYNDSGNAKVFSNSVFAISTLVHGHDILTRKLDSFKSGALSLGERDSKLLGSFAECGWVNTESGRDLLGGGTVKYKLCRVSDVRVRDFSGHVYNLETISGDYAVKATAVSNCRCSYRMVIPDDEE